MISNTTRSSSPALRIWALATLGSTIAASFGYALGTKHNDESTTDQATLVNAYGSSKDFSQAIVTLRTEIPLSEETVSTDPGTLEAHGVSMNDYHPGERTLHGLTHYVCCIHTLDRRIPTYSGCLSIHN